MIGKYEGLGPEKCCTCKSFHSLLDHSLSVEHKYKFLLKRCWEADFFDLHSVVAKFTDFPEARISV